MMCSVLADLFWSQWWHLVVGEICKDAAERDAGHWIYLGIKLEKSLFSKMSPIWNVILINILSPVGFACLAGLVAVIEWGCVVNWSRRREPLSVRWLRCIPPLWEASQPDYATLCWGYTLCKAFVNEYVSVCVLVCVWYWEQVLVDLLLCMLVRACMPVRFFWQRDVCVWTQELSCC